MKLLDKKKTSELFEGAGSSLHQAFIEAVERDKMKPKELDWEKEFDKKFTMIITPLLVMIPSKNIPFEIKQFIKQTLTQQRTELLEEIKKEIESKKEYRTGKPLKNPYYDCDCGYGYDECCCSENRLLEEIIRLLNKKDE